MANPRSAFYTIIVTAIAIAHAAAEPAGKDCPTTTLVTTSTVSLPFSKPLVRSRETLIGNLVASSMRFFLAARYVARV
jgi:hypothetical protein